MKLLGYVIASILWLCNLLGVGGPADDAALPQPTADPTEISQYYGIELSEREIPVKSSSGNAGASTEDTSDTDQEADPTQAPEATKAPEATRAPEPTQAPAATQAPKPTQASQPTRAPASIDVNEDGDIVLPPIPLP